jgi:hypothetical protein
MMKIFRKSLSIIIQKKYKYPYQFSSNIGLKQENEISWNENSLLSDLIKKEYNKAGRNPKNALELIEKQELYYLGDWKKIPEEEKKIFPIGLRMIIDEAAGKKNTK